MATREEYIDKLDKQLRDWNKQIDELQKKADSQSKEIKQRITERREKLQSKRKELSQKLDKIKGSGEDTFEKIKADTETLWDDLAKGLADIKSIAKG